MRDQTPATLGTWALFSSPADFFSCSFIYPMPQFAACKKPKGIMTSVVTLKCGLDYEEVRDHGGTIYRLEQCSHPTWCSTALFHLLGKGPAKVSSWTVFQPACREIVCSLFFPPILAVEAKTHNKVKRVLMTICRRV